MVAGIVRDFHCQPEQYVTKRFGDHAEDRRFVDEQGWYRSSLGTVTWWRKTDHAIWMSMVGIVRYS